MDLSNNLNLNSLFEKSCELHSNKPFLSFVNGKPLTFNDVNFKVQKLSWFLQKYGVEKGTKIAIFSESNPNWGISYLSITKTGAVVVPILPDFNKQEVENILTHSDSEIIFVSKRLYKNLDNNVLKNIKITILIDDFSIISENSTLFSSKKLPSNIIKDIIVNDDINNFKTVDVEEDDLLTIIYTSGTTGTSKGVMLTHKNIISNAIASSKIPITGNNERFLSILPMSHTYEFTLGFVIPIVIGGAVFYLKKPPTPSVLVPAMQKIKPTLMLTVPLIIDKVYRNKILPEFNKNLLIKLLYKIRPINKILNRIAGKKLYNTFGGKLHFFGIGGAKLASDTEKFLRDAKFPYAIGYGLTESSPLLAGTNALETKYRSTGPVLDGIEIKIDNPNSKGEGEILAKGPNIMKGYYKNKELTAETFTDDGWYKTGDLGIFNKNNYLFIKGRIKNMIIGSNGENIYPEEIENVINKNSFVLESIVYELRGKLVAKIHLDYPKVEGTYLELKETSQSMQKKVNELLNEILFNVNHQLNKFSRLQLVIEQTTPFEKTPTQKIKRFLHMKRK
ncbi:MAG: AMP-binding protein [Bacteroidetes bacterium]|nr:AMP-binding protein [Bacteroidota bacterium]